jgi:geranylgeranyl pyrophosphate synthase
LLNRYGAVEVAMNRARHYASLAVREICGFPDSEAKRALLWVLEFVIARNS